MVPKLAWKGTQAVVPLGESGEGGVIGAAPLSNSNRCRAAGAWPVSKPAGPHMRYVGAGRPGACKASAFGHARFDPWVTHWHPRPRAVGGVAYLDPPPRRGERGVLFVDQGEEPVSAEQAQETPVIPQLLAQLAEILNTLEAAGYRPWPAYGEISDDNPGPRVRRVHDTQDGPTWMVMGE